MGILDGIRHYRNEDEQMIFQILNEPEGHYLTIEELDFSGFQEVYVYEEGQVVIGFLCIEVHNQLSQIICYVSPKRRREGIGSKLFEYGMLRLETLDPNTIWLFFRNDVGNSGEFYKKRGAESWYAYHHMFYEEHDHLKQQTYVGMFDEVVNCDQKYHETYIEERARAFYEINKMIDSRPYDERERKADLLKWINKNEDKIYIFIKNGNFIGSIALFNGLFDEIFISEKYRRKGYGKAIVEWALHKCKEEGLEPSLSVVTGNTPAIELYEQCGFKIAQTLELNRLFSKNKAPDLRGPIGG